MARRHFEKAIAGYGAPETVTIDKSGANLAGSNAINAHCEVSINLLKQPFLSVCINLIRKSLLRQNRELSSVLKPSSVDRSGDNGGRYDETYTSGFSEPLAYSGTVARTSDKFVILFDLSVQELQRSCISTTLLSMEQSVCFFDHRLSVEAGF